MILREQEQAWPAFSDIFYSGIVQISCLHSFVLHFGKDAARACDSRH